MANYEERLERSRERTEERDRKLALIPHTCSAKDCTEPVRRSPSGRYAALCPGHLRERSAKYRKTYRSTLHGMAVRLLNSARTRARELDLPFDLTIEWMENELEKAIVNGCPLLGIPIILDVEGRCDNTPSIDQISPRAGYIQQNCWIISWRANSDKNGASLDLMRKVLDEAARRGIQD